MQRLRKIIRWIFVSLAVVYVVAGVPEAFHNFREWRLAGHGDPIAAQFWRSALYMDLTQMAVVIAIAFLIWRVLDPSDPRWQKDRQGQTP